jgi:hypothetical protein
VDNWVHAVSPLANGDLVAGGRFLNAGGEVSAYMARYTFGGTPACAADFDCDGFLTGIDYDLYVAAFEAGEMTADFDGDRFITGIDFDLYVAAFEAGC